MKKYTIYKITNIVNNKVYIGKHETYDLDDGYMGSGKLLKHAQSKYGIESFKKEILYVFDTEHEMNAKEKELVTEEFCLDKSSYNLCVGGQGGFSHIRRDPLLHREYCSKGQQAHRQYLIDTYGVDHNWKTQANRAKTSKRNKVLHELGVLTPPTFKNKRHTEETKNKMSLKAKQRTSNSQTGTMWITNGLENKKVKSIDFIPEGWYKGRKIKNI